MGTLGIQPPQLKIPGNLNNLPKGLTSTLDPNKLKQLSPAQLDAIKNLSPEKLATLNNLPIDQIKNLDPKQLADKVSNLPNSNDVKDKSDKVKKQIKDRKDQEKKKLDELKKSVNDKKGFLKDQAKQSFKDNKSKLAAIATPILLQFIRAENVADILIKKLTKDTKKQLQNKGTLTVADGVFTFTPSNPGNYNVFKTNFDRRVSNLKKVISVLQKTINILNDIVKYLNIALSLVKVYIKIKLVLRAKKLAQLTAEFGAPSPSKPFAGLAIAGLINNIDKLQQDRKKVEEYQAVITALQLFLVIFKEMVAKIKIKIDKLQFTLISSDNNSGIDNNLNTQLEQSKLSVPDTEEYTSNEGRSYILKLVILPNGQHQYQALDSFSKLKITQTAPSRIKTDAELLEEIKQILG